MDLIDPDVCCPKKADKLDHSLTLWFDSGVAEILVKLQSDQN